MGGLPIGRARGGEAAVLRGADSGLARVIERAAMADSPVADRGVPTVLTVEEGLANAPLMAPEDVFTGTDAVAVGSGGSGSRDLSKSMDPAAAAFVDMLAPAGGGTDPGRWGELTDDRGSRRPWEEISENWLGALVPGLAVIGSALAAGVETYSRTNSLSTAMIGAVVAPLAMLAMGLSQHTVPTDGLEQIAPDQEVNRYRQFTLGAKVIEIYDGVYAPAHGLKKLTKGEKTALHKRIAATPKLWILVLKGLEEAALEFSENSRDSMAFKMGQGLVAKHFKVLLALGLWPRPVDGSVLRFFEDRVGSFFLQGEVTRGENGLDLNVTGLFPEFSKTFLGKHEMRPDKKDIQRINDQLGRLPHVLAMVLGEVLVREGEILNANTAQGIRDQLQPNNVLAVFENLDPIVGQR